MKLIDKDALLAEIKRRMSKNEKKQSLPQFFGMLEEDLGLTDFINSLEVKEVDLEEEIERVRKTHFINDDFEKVTLEGRQITNIAKHFFELGLKAQKL